MDTGRKFNKYAEYLIKVFGRHSDLDDGQGMSVNPIVSEIASLYEKFRNAIEYREEEVILRASIERILKRRLILGGKGEAVAGPLVRELVWARYFPDRSITQEKIATVADIIDLFLRLRSLVLKKPGIKEQDITDWIYQLLSATIEDILNPNTEKVTVANLIFHILKKNIQIVDDTEENRDVQVFVAVRRTYAKDDIALLRYHLFSQKFGLLTKENVQEIADSFVAATKEITGSLLYPLRHKMQAYVKKFIPPFLILEDILRNNKPAIREILTDSVRLKEVVFATCAARYESLTKKVQRAIIRSVIFILVTKAFFAIVVEGTYERFVYGEVLWGVIALNIVIPSLLMLIVGFFIKTPGEENSQKILHQIEYILFSQEPTMGYPLTLYVAKQERRTLLDSLFPILWLGAFAVSFGAIVYVLTQLQFNIVSQIFFLFFLAIVSFLAYRIYQTAHVYTVENKQSLVTPIVDFLFVPIVRVGRQLTEGIAQINIILFIFDFLIETPFKGIFGFFEQLFFFLHTKREELE